MQVFETIIILLRPRVVVILILLSRNPNTWKFLLIYFTSKTEQGNEIRLASANNLLHLHRIIIMDIISSSSSSLISAVITLSFAARPGYIWEIRARNKFIMITREDNWRRWAFVSLCSSNNNAPASWGSSSSSCSDYLAHHTNREIILEMVKCKFSNSRF